MTDQPKKPKKTKKQKAEYWIIEYYDEAVHGLRRGKKHEKTVAGPYRSYDTALNIKQLQFRSYRCTYYGIAQSVTKPIDRNSIYDFVDYEREFDDDD